MATLTLQGGESEFHFDSTIVIGRGGTADFVVQNPSVSRRHAIVSRDGDGWYVEDLGSGNGTFLNGRILTQRTRLHDGDQLRLGSSVIRFADAPRAAPPRAPETSVRILEPALAGAGDQILVRVPVVEEPAQHTLVGSARRLRLLENLARISSMVFDERALLSFVVGELFEMMPQADRAFIMLWDEELKRLVPNAARTRSGTPTEIPASRTLLDEVLARREAVLVADAASDPRLAKAQSILALKIRTAICTPIVFQNQIFGVIQVDSAGGSPFTRGDVVLAVGLGAEVGMALAYARVHGQLVEQKLLEHDLELARKIQRRFMPAEPPSIGGYSFGVIFEPALAVGGDVYDFLDLGGGLSAAVIGDVSGKGVSAALYSAKLMTDLRYVSIGLTSPSAILSRVNDVLAASDHEGMFVTAALAVLDAHSGRFTIANAGHPLPFARDRSGRVAALGQPDGPALGLAPGARFRDHQYELDAGDIIVFYTDGVVEALNPQKAMFGEAGLVASLQKPNSTPTGVARTVADDVRAFAGSEPQSDDVTIVAIGRIA